MGNILGIFGRKGQGTLSTNEAWRAKYRFRKAKGKGAVGITPDRFTNLLGPSGQLVAEVLFKYVDADGNGWITYKEICNEIKRYRTMTTPESKLLVLFNFYDQNHDGKISPSEIVDAMKVASQHALPKTQLNQLVNTIMETFDKDKDGYLNLVEFTSLIWNSGYELSA